MASDYPDSYESESALRGRRDELLALRKILATGDRQVTRETADALTREGDALLATTLLLMCAAQRRDVDTVGEILQSPAADLLRAEVIFDYALIWCVYWAAGLAAARPEIERSRARGWGGLPPDWSRDLVHLAALADALGESDPRMHCLTRSEAPLLEGQSLLVTQAVINGLPPAYFIVDTGAPTTVISAEYAEQAGIGFGAESYKESRDGAGHTIRMYPAVLKSLAIGSASALNCPVHVLELSKKLAVKGIISPLESFREAFVEIDMRSRALRISPPEFLSRWRGEAGEPVRSQELLWNEGSPSVPVRVDDQHEGFFLLDSGAGANILCAHLCRRLGLDISTSPHVESATAASQTLVYRGPRGKLAVGDAAARDTDFIVKECSAAPETLFPRMVDGYVGVPWFEGRRVGFAPGGRTMYFTDASRA
jgi:hypothetical protein